MSKKSNLFKFITVRNPQLLDEDRKEQGFVFHPELSDATSSFYQDVVPADPYGQLVSDCNDFDDALLNKNAVKSAFPEMYKFAFWLGKNKNKLTVEAINKQIGASAASITDLFLNGTELKLAWDNLVYQTVKNTNKLVRESLIQIIIADKFVKNFKSVIKDNAISEFDEALGEEFKRRATANVVIPQEFLRTVTKTVDSPLKLASVLTDRLNKDLETAMAQRRTVQYKNQIHNIKIEEFSAHEAVRLEKEAYLGRVKAHRETTGLQPIMVDGVDTGKKEYTKVTEGYSEPSTDTTITQLVDDTITRAPRTATNSSMFRIIP